MTLLEYIKSTYGSGTGFFFQDLPDDMKTNATISQISRLVKGKKLVRLRKGLYAVPSGNGRYMMPRRDKTQKGHSMSPQKRILYAKLEESGAFWSGRMDPDGPMNEKDDDILIEKGLLNLEFEDMHLLFDAYPAKRIRGYWEKNLVPQDDRYGIINRLLGILFFNIKDIDKYIARHAKR